MLSLAAGFRVRLASLSVALLTLGACSSKPIDPGSASAGTSSGGTDSAAAGAESGGAESGGAESGGAESPIDLPVFDHITMSSDAAATYHQTAAAPVDFGTAPVARATLRVQLASPCFPFEGWKTQPTTAGHFWPDACDAFDRQFLLSLDGEDGGVGNGLAPGIELTRAMTPFGGPLAFETDITDLVNGLPGMHTLRVEIPTYSDPDGKISGSKGSWQVTANVVLEPGAAPRKVLAVIPLVFAPLTMATPAPFDFETPAGTTSARIEYRATGHGQGAGSAPACIGPAEEFCHRAHTLTLDATTLGTPDPWRTDCAKLCTQTANTSGNGITTYCKENPCGALQSVRAPRANWCPGSVTPPFMLEGDALVTPGPHELSLAIDELADGGNWLVSATFFAFE